MQKNLSEKLKAIYRQYRKNTWCKRIVTVLSVSVMFITTYMLILPAITLEKEVYCGMEEHKHTSECLAIDSPLICGLLEGQVIERKVLKEDCSVSHLHTEDCYEVILLKPHVHTPECYGKLLICGYEDNEEEDEHTYPWLLPGDIILDNDIATPSDAERETDEESSIEETMEETSATAQETLTEETGEENENAADIHIPIESLGLNDELQEIRKEQTARTMAELLYEDSEEEEIWLPDVDLVDDSFPENMARAVYLASPSNATSSNASQPHKHTDECYADWVICGKKEHTHNKLCYVQNRIPGTLDLNVVTQKNDIGDIIAIELSLKEEAEKEYTYVLETSEDGSVWGVKDTKTNTDAPKFIIDTESIQSTSSLFTIGAHENEQKAVSRARSVLSLILPEEEKPAVDKSQELTLTGLLDTESPGFAQWLAESYTDVQAEPVVDTPKAVLAAYGVYAAAPAVKLSAKANQEGLAFTTDVSTNGKYIYGWNKQKKDGQKEKLHENNKSGSKTQQDTWVMTSSEINTLSEDDFPLIIQSTVTDERAATYISNPIEYNSKAELELELLGIDFSKPYYYGNVAKDPRAGFSDLDSLKTVLGSAYETGGIDAVKAIWDRYEFDLWDPNFNSKNIAWGSSKGALYDNYEDKNLAWPKEQNSLSPFHATVSGKINPLDYEQLEQGVNYSDFFGQLGKTANAVAPGDANQERIYNIDINAKAEASTLTPLVLVFQIQTSWQMFDLEHANALQGEGDTAVGAAARNTELANLYDIKNALIRFTDFVKEYNSTSVAIGITNVQHATSCNMLKSGTKVSNDMDVILRALYGWDTFGDCEHVHYETTELENTVKALSGNLDGWKDSKGEKLDLSKVKKSVVIIGGTTENSSNTNGYGCILPWGTFSTSKINSVYGIRVNEGTPYSKALLSWLEHPSNNQPFPNGFTDKYIATTEDKIYDSLVDIFMREQGRSSANQDIYVEDTVIEDTVTDEFVLLKDTINLVSVNANGEESSIALDPEKLCVKEQEDGTTYISYNFGKVYNGSTVHLKFQVQAKESYIGSNNVYTNVGTPKLTYGHNTDTFSKVSTDRPQVNVPIRFSTVDGGSKTIFVGESAELKDLSLDIIKDAEYRADLYDQINGTLTYTWKLPDGTEKTAFINIANGVVKDGIFPDRSSVFYGNKEGTYNPVLNVTFTPQAANSVSGEAVNERTEKGNTWITVVDKTSKTDLIVRKEWFGGNDGKSDIKFQLLGNGTSVTYDGRQEFSLGESNQWEKKFTGLPLVGDDSKLIKYTVKETPVPEGYYDGYREEQKLETDTVYGTKITIFFKSTARIDPNKKVEIQYSCGDYNGSYVLDKDTHERFEANKEYSFTFIREDIVWNPSLMCDIKGIYIDNKLNNNVKYSANVEKVETGSTTTITPVLIITNTPASILPNTGGTGTTRYTLGGLAIMFLAGMLWYSIYYTRKGGRK